MVETAHIVGGIANIRPTTEASAFMAAMQVFVSRRYCMSRSAYIEGTGGISP